jgi:hypothetical protein
MQTFLPYASFEQSAVVLDRQRLGKQRVEGLQLLRALSGMTKGWVNHPAAKMWRGHEWLLFDYTRTICSEWVMRGYTDTCYAKVTDLANEHGSMWGDVEPLWLGVEAVHLSHRSNLVRKAPDHYGPLFPDTPDDLPYVWPS